MKTLNGKAYYEKPDLNEIRKNAIFYTSHSDEDYEFLYIVTNDERNVVIQGIEALHNTLMWEFTSETAINQSCIEKCHKTLQVYKGSLMHITEYNLIPPSKVTRYCDEKVENWLKSKGYEIFLKFLQKFELKTIKS
jgi:hypothetical protein